MWKNMTILRKYNIYIVDIGTDLNLYSEGLLGEGSLYKNPSFVPSIHSIYMKDPRGQSYTINTEITKVGKNIYKIGSINNENVKCKIKVLVYES